MMLLIDFLCRFGWGLALALTLTPAGLVPAGFFRANLLVVLGLATLAALLEWTAGPGAAWLVPAAAAVAAWLGSIAWLAERKGAGLVLCGTCALLFAVATAQLHPFQAQVWPAAVAAIRALLSGLLVGLVVHAMLLGHWYLNAGVVDATLAGRADRIANFTRDEQENAGNSQYAKCYGYSVRGLSGRHCG